MKTHRFKCQQDTVVPRLLTLLVLLAISILPVFAAENMIGRQSQNEGIQVLPAPGEVTIDGDLKDWDLSGRIWVFADSLVRSRYSVEESAMWDNDNLYLAAKWKDPTPMFSLIDPGFNPDEGWKEDAWQIRLANSDSTVWLTTWYFTTKEQPVLHLNYWKNKENLNDGTTVKLLVAKPGGIELGEGAEMCYKADADGKGFVQEMKIPWKLLYKTVPAIKAGESFHMGSEFLWSDPTGKTWPVHRYADNMQPGKTEREFFWTARNIWGDATLAAAGNVPVRQYVSDGSRIAGTIPVQAVIPKDASRFTIVIEDQQGNRIRNLAGDCDPLDYAVNGKDDAKTRTVELKWNQNASIMTTLAAANMRTVEVKWDGLDDKGKLVPAGDYRVRGLTQKGISAEYEMCFYNPGTPQWAIKDGSGAWGGDHAAPNNVAAGGDWTVVTWPFAEGGSGIVAIDPTGKKRWGDRRGVTMIAADANYVYANVTGWYVNDTICRFGFKDGSLQPFVLDGKPRIFDLPITEITGIAKPGAVKGMAVNGNKLVLSLDSGKLVILDALSAAVIKQFDIDAIGQVAFSKDGKLFVMSGGQLNPLAGMVNGQPLNMTARIGGKLNQVNLDTGALTVIATPGLGNGGAISVDNDGNIVIIDNGADCQAKAYSQDGKLVYTCGKKGGRPIRGDFDEQAMLQMSSVAVDSKGNVWVVENWNYPRRVSVWGKDGKLVRDYIGNTGYSGADSYLHDQNPDLAYTGPIEMKIDHAGNWKVTKILWVPDETKGENFTIDTASNEIPSRFTSSASGKAHEYMFDHESRSNGSVLFMERNGNWQPVSAITIVGYISGGINYNGSVKNAPSGEFAGLNTYDGVIWNDTNKDGKVQRNECQIILTKQQGTDQRSGQPGIGINNGWGGRMGDDLSIYTDGLMRYKPITFTEDGAPIYSLEGRYPVGVKDNGDIVPVPGEDRLIVLSMDGYAGPTKLTGVNTRTGMIDWYYANPYPGVHGSHRATMPSPGLLIGPLKTMGTAKISEDIGTVFALRGNLGQDFFLTSDGLFVGSLFQDGRLPGDSLPDKESQLKGVPMDTFSEGGEPFNGWFGKQTDGKVRLTTGMAREAAMILQIKGLESIQRFNADTIKVTLQDIVQADADNNERAKVQTAAKIYDLVRTDKAPAIDANPAEWKAVNAISIAREGQPDKGSVKLTYDDTNLYALFEVSDPNPWLNTGKDFGRLFKSGDAVDLQLSNVADTKPQTEPRHGDMRIVISQLQGKPVAVLMMPVDPAAPKEFGKNYTTGWTKHFDRVAILDDANIAVKTNGNKYIVEASLPLAKLGLTLKPGTTIYGDAGFISSDPNGLIDTARTYWSNQATNLVNDEPLEAWIYPGSWGEFKVK